jgi:orotate phosphoribosyltransferase
MTPAMSSTDLAQAFVRFSVDNGALRFGEFTTKAGRLSPYFFNAGLFDDGAKLGRLAYFYAARIAASPLTFDMIFGPAYKGITLAAALAVELARQGRNVPYAYNRKEAKDHGEGGVLVGAPMAGKRVLIVDDVISAGTSVRESIQMIEGAGGVASGVAIALDRQETTAHAQGDNRCSAVQFVQQNLKLEVCAIAGLADLLHHLDHSRAPGMGEHKTRVAAYRDQYGI